MVHGSEIDAERRRAFLPPASIGHAIDRRRVARAGRRSPAIEDRGSDGEGVTRRRASSLRVPATAICAGSPGSDADPPGSRASFPEMPSVSGVSNARPRDRAAQDRATDQFLCKSFTNAVQAF